MYGQSSTIYFYLCLLVVFVASASAANIKKTEIKDDYRITNGQCTTIDKFPQIVQIVDKFAFNNNGFICGGTLISDRHVVSAAHCFRIYDAISVIIIANATYLEGDKGGIKRNVSDIYKHPKYNETTDDYDVVVIKLSKPLTFGKGVQKADMCTETWKDNENIIVSGWGRIKENAPIFSNQLQTVQMDTLSNVECQKEFDGLTKQMACSVVTKGQDACQGDSGGPAFYHGKLCGVVSVGFGCGESGSPAIFASIPNLSEFIAESMAIK